MWLCVDKLKGKTGHLRLPSASRKRACLNSLMSDDDDDDDDHAFIFKSQAYLAGHKWKLHVNQIISSVGF